MNTVNHNNCDGCYTCPSNGDSYDIACGHASRNTKGQCPCTQCIVKVMCEEPCVNYSQFRRIPLLVELKASIGGE